MTTPGRMLKRETARRFVLPVIVVLTVTAAGGFWLYSRHTAVPDPITSSGGDTLTLLASDSGAYFLQRDPRWANDAIGGSGEPMSAVGCTVCAIAMAASELGQAITPKELNASLTRESGYTRDGWLIWSAVSGATDGKIRVRVPSGLNYSEIDESLRSGSIPVVKFYLPCGISHWVPIIGKDGTEYLVKDSLDEMQRVAPLSEKATEIVAVRYVEKGQ